MVDASNSPVPNELLARLFQKKVVPMLGAGCSAASPSNLPPAGRLAEYLIDRGAGRQGQALEDIAEAAWARGGWQEFAQLLPTDEWRARPPNVIVRVIAELCREGLITIILTTNWDLLIEAALAQIGQPFAKVVDAQSLAVEPTAEVVVVKLNGCIDHPELIRAKRSDIESMEWLDAWVEAVFDLIVRTNSMLFAGYSGATHAATSTISRIVSADERAASDYVIDRQTPEAMAAASEAGARFIEAINLASAFTGEAAAFFDALRRAAHPLLLAEPTRTGDSMASRLIEPTALHPDALKPYVHEIAAWFRAAKPDACQTWLLRAFASFPDADHVAPYLPLRRNANEIAKAFLVLAVTKWAERLMTPSADLGFILSARLGDMPARLPYLVIACNPTERADAAAYAAVLELERSTRGERSAVAVGVKVGGIGQVNGLMTTFSVARGSQVASAARSGGAAVAWIDGDQLFSDFEENAGDAEIQASVRARLDSAAERALTPS